MVLVFDIRTTLAFVAAGVVLISPFSYERLVNFLAGIAFETGLTAVIIAVLGGLGVRYALKWRKAVHEVNWIEYAIGAAIIALGTTPIVSIVGTKIAHAQAVGGYVQYLGASIKAVEVSEVACNRDGACLSRYKCDRYKEWYYSRGKLKSRDKWHDCPYATKEYHYSLTFTFGDPQKIAVLGDNPQPWRDGKAIPDEYPRTPPVTPVELELLKQQGILPPATWRNEYVNYYLASQDTTQKEWGGDVPGYKKRELIKPHTVNYDNAVYSGIKARKVVFAGRGFKLNNEEFWQEALMYLNAKTGFTVRGDVHLYVVPASQVGEGEAAQFTSALLAYQQGEELDKHGLAKNAILLVVAVDDAQQKVVWARGRTGLPGDNNSHMLGELSRRLPGTDFHPLTLLGKPTARMEAGNPVYSLSGGLVDQIVNHDAPYQRECMDCKDKDDKGTGFTYLDSETLISGWARFWIIVFGVLAAAVVWAIFAYLPLFEGVHPGRRRARNRNNTTFS